MIGKHVSNCSFIAIYGLSRYALQIGKLSFSASKIVGSTSTSYPNNLRLPKASCLKKSSTLFRKHSEEKRCYSTERPNSQYPNIMDFPVIIWPNIFKSARNWILSNFIISKYFDRQFSIKEFVRGSKKAVGVVSKFISKGDLDSLTGLVSPEAISEVRQHLYNFSLRQQSELAICEEDIFLCFPYEVGIMFEDKIDSQPQRRFVEITMCYHVLSGLKELRESHDPPPIWNAIPDYQKRMYVVNYRFVREFTADVEANWIINGFNHLKAVD